MTQENTASVDLVSPATVASQPVPTAELVPTPPQNVSPKPKGRPKGSKSKKHQQQPTPEVPINQEIVKQRPAHLFKPGQSGNPDGRPKTRHFTEAINRVFHSPAADAKDVDALGHMFKLIKQKMIHFLEDDDMEIDDLHILIQDIEVLAARVEGKPSQSGGEEGGSGTPSLTINIGTRFTPATHQQPQGEVIEAEVVKSA